MRYLMLGAALMAAVSTSGCLTARPMPIMRIVAMAEPRMATVSAGPRTLGVRVLESAMPYKQKAVYRTNDFEIKYYDAVEWSELPRDIVTRVLQDALIASGRFGDVGNAADMRAPDLVLTGQLRKFDEVRAANGTFAECEVRLELRAGLTRDAVWADTLRVSEPLGDNSPGALAVAMSQAVARVAEQAAADIIAADQQLPEPAPAQAPSTK